MTKKITNQMWFMDHLFLLQSLHFIEGHCWKIPLTAGNNVIIKLLNLVNKPVYYYKASKIILKEVAKYKSKCGKILSFDFFSGGNSFLASGDLVNRQSAEHNLIVWDTRMGAKISNQLYHVSV